MMQNLHTGLCVFLFFVTLCVLSVFSAHLDLVPGNQIVRRANIESDIDKPQQLHLAFGSSCTEIVVMWATAEKDETILKYWTKKTESDPKVEKGKSVVFDGNRQGFQHLHRVSVKDLTPGLQYFYTVGGTVDAKRSNTYYFNVPLKYTPHTYMVYGDLGTRSATLPFLVHEASGSATGKLYTAIFHVGDIAYDLGRNGGKVGDQFLNKIQKMAAQVPYMTVPGDHDLFIDEQYRYRFSNPNADWPMKMDQLWYSIDVGKTHFVCISTEVFFSDKKNIPVLLEWMRADLDKANENRSHYPWVVVMTHRPIYCTMTDMREDCTKVDSVVRRNLESIYYRYGVDVVFSGHEHLYERTWPMYNGHLTAYNYINPMAPVHLIVGSLGNQYMTDMISKTGAAWSAFRKSRMEMEIYGRLTVYNYTHLQWEARSAMDNSLVDKMLIIQRTHGPFTQEKAYIPDPLGEAGKQWRDRHNGTSEQDDNSFINLNFFLVYDDVSTRITVLTFTSIILIIGLIFRKKVVNMIRICCIKNEKCNNLSSQ